MLRTSTLKGPAARVPSRCSCRRRRFISRASDGDALTPEEAAVYEELLARRKAERQRAIQEAKHRSKFNPLPPQQPSSQGLGTFRDGSTQHAASGAPPPRPAPKPTKLEPPATAPSQRDSLQGMSTTADNQRQQPEQGSVTNARAARSLLRRSRLPKDGSGGLLRRAAALARRGAQARRQAEDVVDEAEGSDDETVDESELAALGQVAQLLLEGKAPAGLEDAGASVPARAQPASTPKASSYKQAAALGGARVKTRLGPSLDDPRLLDQVRQLMEQDSDSDDEDSGQPNSLGDRRPKMVKMDDIDWEALEAFESLEASMALDSQLDILATDRGSTGQLGEERGVGSRSSPGQSDLELRRPQPPRPDAATSSSSNSQSSSASGRPRNSISSTSSGSSSSSSSSRGAPKLFAQPQASPLALESGSKTQPPPAAASTAAVKPHAGAAQRKGEAQQSRGQRAQHMPQASGPAPPPPPALPKAPGVPGQASGMDLALLEALLLGKDWEQRELGDLAPEASIPEGSRSGQHQQEELGPEPWADEVTSMLLSLVLMSHKRYCQTPLLPDNLPEEQRAQAMWDAPWALLVQDDSRQAMLEYANKAALDMLGLNDFLDVYELSVYDVIDSSEKQQQDWLWATAEVEDGPERKTRIRSMLFKRQSKDITTAKATDVVLFRVDSLEGTPVALACLIHKWQ